MANLQINSLYNLSVYVDGIGFVGRAEEVDVPHPKAVMADYKGLGMAGVVEFPMGFDKLEARIKWKTFDFETMNMIVNPFQAHFFQFRGSIDQITSQGRAAQLPVVYLLTGFFKDGGKGAFKHQAPVEYESMVAATHVELSIAGVPVYLYDAIANQFIVNGIDQLAQFRANLGG